MSEITTAEELDALPVGSVVLDEAGVAWQRQAPPNEDARSFWRAADVSHAAFGSQLSGYGRRFRRVFRPGAAFVEDRFHDIAHAVTEAYMLEGQGIWWRAWAMHPEKRARMEAGVLAAWSGQSTDGIDPLSDAARLRAGVEALADEWERTRVILLAGGVGEGMLSFRDAAARLRALLSADDEPEVSA